MGTAGWLSGGLHVLPKYICTEGKGSEGGWKSFLLALALLLQPSHPPSPARHSCGHSVTQSTLLLPSPFLPTGIAGSVLDEENHVPHTWYGMCNVKQQNYFVRWIKYRQNLHVAVSAFENVCTAMGRCTLFKIDCFHSLKGNSKLFKLVLFFKSVSLVVLGKDFFHKRKFSKLILQLVILRSPHKDVAYIEEREIRTTTPRPYPQNCFCFALGDDEIILEKLSPMMERGCTSCPVLWQVSKDTVCAWTAQAVVQPV